MVHSTCGFYSSAFSGCVYSNDYGSEEQLGERAQIRGVWFRKKLLPEELYLFTNVSLTQGVCISATHLRGKQIVIVVWPS